MTVSVTEIAEKLISCASVTPHDAGAQTYLTQVLQGLGFVCHSLPFGDVPNLFARIGTGGPHLCFAGHTDVVPPGPLEAWTSDPFAPTIRDGRLYGRGASDMKGAVAAFVAACAGFLQGREDGPGSISLLITGDEEGPATHGTVRILEWMKDNGHIPDVCLVGEPTNPAHLGQEIKIGRRGSLGGTLTVTGKQGHVAYPQNAENPLPGLVKLLDALATYVFDRGTEFFSATHLEITSIDVGNAAGNVIPGRGQAKFNIRFNDQWTAETLERRVRQVLDSVGGCSYTLETVCGAESFLTRPGPWATLVQKAVEDVTGKTASFTTTGGTSDARFIVKHCPVVEFGAVNATIHQADENAELQVLEDLTKIYQRILELYLNAEKIEEPS